MRYEEDYRFCVTAALQIMQQQRKKLYQDCVEYEPTIYSGLHSSNSKSVRHLYFQSYFIEWISLHWESMIERDDSVFRKMVKEYKSTACADEER